MDYSVKEISRNSKVCYSTTKALKKVLLRQGFIRQTREVGKAKMYRLNDSSKVTKAFRSYHKALVEQD